MRSICIAVVAMSLVLTAARANPPDAAAAGPSGQRAFDDLADLYRGGVGPDLPALWQALHDADSLRREDAGEQLLALCQQSFADEVSGRSAHSRLLPAFGERLPSMAREFRETIARQLPDNAGGALECLPALWMLSNDLLADVQLAAATTLQKIHSPAADELLISIIRDAHPNGAVLAKAIKEADARGLRQIVPRLPALAMHYRADVREAAQAAATRFGVDPRPTFDASQALASAFDVDLRDATRMVLTPIRSNATFVSIVINYPAGPKRRRPVTRTTYGWLLSKTADKYEVLDEFGSDQWIDKSMATITSMTLAVRADQLLALRADEAAGVSSAVDALRELSLSGSFSGQFEPRYLRLPEALIAAWSYQRGDIVTAANLLLPRLQMLDDQRWFRQIVRDLLGHDYHQQMLSRLADYWDYAGAMQLAAHLNTPLFDGYEYQYRAAALVEQLPRRATEDFRALSLPTPAAWHCMRRSLARTQQVDYLAARLRLISCRQLGWPCDVNLRDEQRSEPVDGGIYADDDRARGVEVINPYTELRNMSLEPAEAARLIPLLMDDDYLLTYHVWRPWHPGWETFQVNELVEALINDAAGERVASLDTLALTPADECSQYLVRLGTELAHRRSRLRQALVDLRAPLQSPADPITGVIAAAAAVFWYRRRQSRTSILALGVATFLSLAAIAVVHPSLRLHRTHEDVDGTTVILLLGGAGMTLQLRHGSSAARAAAITLIALGAGWAVERYVYLGRWISGPVVTLSLLMVCVAAIRLRRSRTGVLWLLTAVVSGGAALASRDGLGMLFSQYHARPGPDVEVPMYFTHPAWTLAMFGFCVSLLQWIWSQRDRNVTIVRAAAGAPPVDASLS